MYPIEFRRTARNGHAKPNETLLKFIFEQSRNLLKTT